MAPRPFAPTLLDGAPGTTRLVTTRRDDILPENTIKVTVDAMTDAEAERLLIQGLQRVDMSEQAELRRLATERLGEWPILLSLVNRYLRTRVDRGEGLGYAIARVTEQLDRRGLVAFDRTLEIERTTAVEKTVGVSFDLLEEFDIVGHRKRLPRESLSRTGCVS